MKYSARALLAVIGGILTAYALSWRSAWFLLLSMLFLTAAILGIIRRYRRFGILFALVLLFFSSFLTSVQREKYWHSLRQNAAFTGETIEVSGWVIRRLEAVGDGGNCSFIIGVSQKNGQPYGKITVYSMEALDGVDKGKQITIKGKFRRQLPGKRCLPEYAERQKITGSLQLTSADALIILDGGFDFVRLTEKFRNRLLDFGKKQLNYSSSTLLHGMIYNEALPANQEFMLLEEAFRRTGTVHLLTVSGLHVGFLALAFGKLFFYLRLPRLWRMLMTIILIWLYAFMSGGESAVLRASVMISACMAAQLSNAESSAMNNLSLAGLVLLLLNPCNLLDVGCQLSFAATFGCVWLFAETKHLLNLKNVFWRNLTDVFRLSLAVQVMLLPLSSCYFREMSLCSPLINVFLFLPAEMAVVFGIFGEFLGLLWQPLGWLLLQIANLNLFLIKETALCFSKWSLASIQLPPWSWLWLAAYYPMLLLTVDKFRPNIITGKPELSKFSVVMCFLIAVNLFFFGSWHIIRNSDFVETIFLSNNHNSTVLLKMPDDLMVLCGGSNEGSGTVQVLRELDKQKIKRLTALIVLNSKRSNLYGILKILEEIKVEKVYLPAVFSSDETNEALAVFRLRCEQLDVSCVSVAASDELAFGRHIEGKVLSGFDSECAAFFVRCGENKLFITGKLDAKSERILVKNFSKYIRESVLRIENAEFTRGFLAHSQPSQVFFGVSAVGKNNFSETSANRRLTSMGIKVYDVAGAGTITARLYP